jgi:hypothetical protein
MYKTIRYYHTNSCILCGKKIEKKINFTYKKFINNSKYEFIFDKENCFLQFKRLASVYGETFELEAMHSLEKNLLII